MRLKTSGISLIELMIIVILISVVATAFLGSKIRNYDETLNRTESNLSDDSIRSALDDISYRLRFAGYGSRGINRPVTIAQGERADKLSIVHNGALFEYFIDESNNLVRKVGATQEVLATHIKSLKVFITGKETVIVTISTESGTTRESDGSRMLSRSFSTAVTASNLS